MAESINSLDTNQIMWKDYKKLQLWGIYKAMGGINLKERDWNDWQLQSMKTENLWKWEGLKRGRNITFQMLV